MATTPRLTDLLPIALDMTASLTREDRSRRLVEAVLRAIPCDAVALLRLEGDVLIPIAAQGLSPDVLGRRFPRGEHPRLDQVCRAEQPTIFPADSGLPDPYDGLIGDEPELHVHACLGCPLRVEGRLVGVLTADAFEPGTFDGVDRQFLAHLAALAAAALRTSDLIESLERAARQQGQVARDLVRDVLDRRGGILIGSSPAMQALRQEIELVGRSELPVLITGETGVGKELVARMLHVISPRAGEALVYVNCAALPESIVESELFGHERGAFTGAQEARPGRFRSADGASLLLDEIGELPLHVQPKLLRVLQEGEVQPVGSDSTTRVDVRVFAATNREIEREVAAGRFRSDLLHRLDVCRIHVPPLREHPEDIPLLAGHFCDRARRRLGTGPIRIAPDAMAVLKAGTWPGNVRELENAISRAILHAGSGTPPGEPVIVRRSDVSSPGIPPADTPQPARAAAAARGQPLRDALREFQRAAVRDALKRNNGSWAAAARELGMHRSNLHHLAERLGLR